MSESYVNEYIFNGVFDQSVITNPPSDPDFIINVSNCVDLILSILSNNNGINSLSSFIQDDSKLNYKITVYKT